MKKQQYKFSSAECSIYLDANFAAVMDITRANVIVITDENIWNAHQEKFIGISSIVIPAGERFKTQTTVDNIIEQLISLKADRQTFIIGVGGGVVTDIAGYVASVYMRGLKFGFVPTSILAMVDAAIGGKNGIDVGLYKNMVGTIRQPEFILYDLSFLQTLPDEQWINGFAEIIKHACIKDAPLFQLLRQQQLIDFQNDHALLARLIERNVFIKAHVVMNDEFEKGERKLLNFGHTIGHAIENMYQLLHGHAVSIGMMAAARISEEINDFPSKSKNDLSTLLQQYHLPVEIQFDKTAMFGMLGADKKRENDSMSFILLSKIGEAVVKPIPMGQLKDIIEQSL